MNTEARKEITVSGRSSVCKGKRRGRKRHSQRDGSVGGIHSLQQDILQFNPLEIYFPSAVAVELVK